MRLRQYLTEAYVGRVKERFGEGSTEVFKNPTRKELKGILEEWEDFRAFLTNEKDCIAFSSGLLHHDVRGGMNLPRDSLALQIWIYGNTISIRVTDNNRGNKWHHNPKIRDFIMNHKYLKRFKIEDIDYYDEAIVGPWEELE